MIALVAAVAKNGVIGSKNQLPWHLPEDLKRFKELTVGKTVLMGRKTFEAILRRNGKPLPNRKNVVVTRQVGYTVPHGVLVYHSVNDALDSLKNEDIYVIGGGEIYTQTIGKADILYITRVERDAVGDAHFPPFSSNEWTLTKEEPHGNFTFTTYTRKTSNPLS